VIAWGVACDRRVVPVGPDGAAPSMANSGAPGGGRGPRHDRCPENSPESLSAPGGGWRMDVRRKGPQGYWTRRGGVQVP